MQIERLFSITYYLINHKKTTSKELANRFEVSVRTILRDIDILSMAGIPIYTAQGTGGGIFLDQHYVLNKTTLTQQEQQRIILALKSICASGQLEAKLLAGKLENLFAQNHMDMMEIDFSRWGSPHTDKIKFEQLISAIVDCRKISFSYVNMSMKKSERKAYPMKLKFQSKAWYLQAVCENNNTLRTFKINRIFNLHIQDEMFDKSKLSVFSAPEDEKPFAALIELKLRFSSYVVYKLYDDFDVNEIVLDKNGEGCITINVPETDWIYSYILSFGTDVEVIGPEHIKKKICKIASEIQKKYCFAT